MENEYAVMAERPLVVQYALDRHTVSQGREHTLKNHNPLFLGLKDPQQRPDLPIGAVRHQAVRHSAWMTRSSPLSKAG